MYRIQTIDKISDKGLALFSEDDYTLETQECDADSILVRSSDLHEMQLPNSLKAIARAGAGVNNIPTDKCTERGIVVFNTPGANANAAKELALAGLFLAARNIFQAITWTQSLLGSGEHLKAKLEKGKKQFIGPEICGKKLGVIGLGAIGVGVANDAKALGMEVCGFDPFISVKSAWGLSRAIEKASGLDSLLAESDYISIHVPLSGKTRNMIDSDKLALMKPGMRLLNFARDGLIETESLIEALNTGRLACYVTDFPYEEALIEHPKVIALPHLGASTPEAEENCAAMAVRQLKNFLENGNIVNSVNFPNCELPPSGPTRIIIANHNVPNMVGQITGVLADNKINIAAMNNRNRGEIAYNIISADSSIGDAEIQKIKAIEGVIMARLIRC